MSWSNGDSKGSMKMQRIHQTEMRWTEKMNRLFLFIDNWK